MWQFILTDLTGTILGEVTNANERKITLPHMRVPTASFKVPLQHELAGSMLDSDTILKCYRTDDRTSQRDLAFCGPVISAEEASDGQKQGIAVTATGPMWRLTKRLLGTTRAGIAWTNQDLGLTAHNILSAINGGSFTGISVGSRTASVTGSYGPVWLKNAAEAITELHAGLNSFEYVVVPTEPTSVAGVGGWPQIGVMNIEPLVGDTRQDAIFEYGTTRANVGTYNRIVTRDGILTKSVMSVQGWPDAPEAGQDLIVRSSDQIAARGLFEEVVNDAGIIDPTLRTGVSDFHLAIRKNPRQQIMFRPVTNAQPSPFVDYKVGDTVRARAVVRGNLRFDALFRIWGITFDVDTNGNEAVELELVMP